MSEKQVKKRSLSSYLSNVNSRREELERIAKKKAEEEERLKREQAEKLKREEEEKLKRQEEEQRKLEDKRRKVEEEKIRKQQEIEALKKQHEEQLKKYEEEKALKEATNKDELTNTASSFSSTGIIKPEPVPLKKSDDNTIFKAPSPKKHLPQQSTTPSNMKTEDAEHKKLDSTDNNPKLNLGESLSREKLKDMLKTKNPRNYDEVKDDELSDTPTEPASPPKPRRGRLVRGDQIERSSSLHKDGASSFAGSSDSELSDIDDIKSVPLSSSVFLEGGLSPDRKAPKRKENLLPSSPIANQSEGKTNQNKHVSSDEDDEDFEEESGEESTYSNKMKSNDNQKPRHSNSKISKQKKGIYRDSGGRTRLQIACDKGKYDVAKRLIEEEDYDVNDQDNAGNSALHEAALNGHLSIVKLLISHGANVNIQSYEMFKDTPLVDASANGHLDIVRYLLRHGADPTIPNAKGLTAYESIEEDSDLDENEIKVVQDIKKSLTEATRKWNTKHGIHESINTSDNSGQSSPMNKHIEESTTAFNDEFYWTDISSSGGKKKLFRASKEGYLPYVGSYLENGGVPDFNAFLEAVKFGHEDIASLFLAFGAKINKFNKEGMTPLMIAVGRNHLGTVKLLLEAGANPTLKDNKGQTAIYHSKHNIFNSINDEEIKLLETAVTKWHEKDNGEQVNNTYDSHSDTEQRISKKRSRNRRRAKFESEESSEDDLSEEEEEEFNVPKKRHQTTQRSSASSTRHNSEAGLHKHTHGDDLKGRSSSISDSHHDNDNRKTLKFKSSSNTDISTALKQEQGHMAGDRADEHRRPKFQTHLSESQVHKEEEMIKETPEEREKRLKAEEEYIQKRLQQKKKKEMELLHKMEIVQQKREKEKEKQRIEEEKRQEELLKQQEIELAKRKEAEELERRKAIRALYPLGLKLISYTNKDDYHRYLPLYYYVDDADGTRYVLDIQMSVILKDDELTNREYDRKHKVGKQETRQLWNLLKFIYLYGGNFTSDDRQRYVVNFDGVDIETRLGFETLEYTKFANLPMHWIPLDAIQMDSHIRDTLQNNMFQIDLSPRTRLGDNSATTPGQPQPQPQLLPQPQPQSQSQPPRPLRFRQIPRPQRMW